MEKCTFCEAEATYGGHYVSNGAVQDVYMCVEHRHDESVNNLENKDEQV